MADIILQVVHTQALDLSGTNIRLSSPPRQRTVLKTIEHPWTKIKLSRGGRRKMFNPGLMNKLIKIE